MANGRSNIVVSNYFDFKCSAPPVLAAEIFAKTSKDQ
jgi:hypothetical protein